MSQVDSILDD